MQSIFKLIFSAVILLQFGCITHAMKKKSSLINRADLRTSIEKTIKSIDEHVNVGVLIASLENDEAIFEQNADRNFTPASTIKLFTLASALHYLGPFFRFDTAIYTDSINADGTIKNLYIKGSGDPSLRNIDLAILASEIAQMGIKKIDGHIYVDDTIFDDVSWPEGMMWDDRVDGFGGPTRGLNINRNCLLIKTIPAIAGKKALAIMHPQTSFVKLKNSVNTVAGSTTSVSWSVKDADRSNEGLLASNQIELTGQIGISSGPHYSKLAIKDPSIWAGHLLKEELIKSKIKVSEKVARKAVSNKAKFLTKHVSRSLGEALIDFMKISDNIGIEALIKAMAAQVANEPATFSKGLELVRDFLKNQVGINTTSLINADASGLSRYNLVTPRQLVTLLKYVDKNFLMAPEFMASLSIGGEDGLLKSRMKEEVLKRRVRAKSGAMSGISSLAGFLHSGDERFAFAIMINGFVGSTAKYSKMQDEILSSILKKPEVELAEKPRSF